MKLEQTVHRLWHAVAADEALAALDCRREGLESADVEARRRLFGPNELPKPKRPGLVALFVRQFKSPIIYLLLAAAVVSVAIGEGTDATFIFAVLMINAVIGTIQEWKAETSAEALSAMIHNWVVVRRNGERHRIDGAELVPGDMVLLESGTLVPADIRLVSAIDVKADESLLTGESLPVGKTADLVLPEQSVVGDRRNMLHAGSTVLNGRAEGVVTQTGLHTEIGRIAQALTTAKTAAPPLVIRLERFTRTIGALVVGAVIIIALVEYLKGMAPADIFFVAVALVVSAIPEGLPVAITIALSVGTARMARRNVIVRSLPAVEGLGACTLIASDKTGTLTCNELTVKRLFLPGLGDVQVEGEGYQPRGQLVRSGQSADGATKDAAGLLAVAGALCNEATFRLTEDGYHHFGDTVDVAFLVLGGKLGVDRDELLEHHAEVGFVPFESARRFAASINRHGAETQAHVKGAAEVVLPLCDGIDQQAMLNEAERMAADGYRVLAVASGPIADVAAAEKSPDGLRGLAFLGLVGLIDPLRAEVPDAVARCGQAGVQVRMVTGDHPATALAISRELDIAESRDQVVTGVELAGLASDPAETDLTVDVARVFARVEPIQKLAIIESCQRGGHFVAVTGDGVNDAPALRAAHIGVAMGKEGTDVARGAADLILTDDNFASIVNGIEEGRTAYDNVRKVIYLLVSTGASEIVLFFLALIAGLPLPLFAVQLLWLNLVTNGVQHIGLSFEKAEPGVVKRPPRPPDQPIFDRAMIEQTAISGLFIGIVAFLVFWWQMEQGVPEFQARNTTLLLMVLFENAHVFNCRSESRSVFRVPLNANWLLIILVAAAQAIHIAAAYVPGLNTVLRMEPYTFETWITVAPIALGLVVVMEIYKAIRYGRDKPH